MPLTIEAGIPQSEIGNPPFRTRPPRGPGEGRVRTLEQVGVIVHMLGSASRPLTPYEVLMIERRAMRKLRRRLEL